MSVLTGSILIWNINTGYFEIKTSCYLWRIPWYDSTKLYLPENWPFFHGANLLVPSTVNVIFLWTWQLAKLANSNLPSIPTYHQFFWITMVYFFWGVGVGTSILRANSNFQTLNFSMFAPENNKPSIPKGKEPPSSKHPFLQGNDVYVKLWGVYQIGTWPRCLEQHQPFFSGDQAPQFGGRWLFGELGMVEGDDAQTRTTPNPWKYSIIGVYICKYKLWRTYDII